MLRKYVSPEFYILCLYIFFDFVQVIFLVNTHIFMGDFFSWEVTVPNYIIWLIFYINVIIYLFFFKLYSSFIKEKKLLKKHIYFDATLYKFIDYLFFFLAVASLLYVLMAGLRAGHYRAYNFYFITRFADVLFPFYYILNRNKKNKIIYTINIVLYVITSILEGWSGIILMVGILEFYVRSKGKVHLAYLLLIPLIILLGILLYQYVFPLKIAIRSNTDVFNIKPIPFEQSAYLLLGRLSMFSNLIVIIQHSHGILQTLNDIFPQEYFENLKIIRFLLPPFIAKEIFPWNLFLYGGIGNVLWIYNVGYDIAGSLSMLGYGPTFLGVLYLLLLRNPMEAYLFIFAFFVWIFYIKIILDAFYDRKLYFPFFLYLLYIVREGGDNLSAAYIFTLTIFFIVTLFAKSLINLLKFFKKELINAK